MISSGRRYYCENIPDAGGEVELNDSESRHVGLVQRARSDDSIVLLDGRGGVADAVIVAGRQRRRGPVRCRICTRSIQPKPMPQRVLFVAPPRAKPMSRLIRSAVELGIGKIVPVITAFHVVEPGADATTGWQIDAIEACKQSGNPYVPEITMPASFAATLAECTFPCVYGHPAAAGTNENSDRAGIRPFVTDDPTSVPPVMGIWIGPEGGFAPEEIRALAGRGHVPLAVGPYILRVETAVVACISALSSAIDLNGRSVT